MQVKSKKPKGKIIFASLRLCGVILFFTVALSAQWVRQNVETTASLRGLSVVNEKIVWASGTGGTVIRTIDGGKTWKVMTVPGAEKLDFRDIEAFDANTAYILSIGNGDTSRIYKTIDGGVTWKEQFRNKNEKAFFDAIACWDAKNCIAMSDPVDGKFLLIETKDGERWTVLDNSRMPPAKDGEAAFAASGTCLITQGKRNAFLVSGGSVARVFRSNDRGKTWNVADTPIAKGTQGSGIFSIAMFNDKIGVIVGGNYEKPEERDGTFAMTNDGGVTWYPGARLTGYRSGTTYLDKDIVVAVGPNGANVSFSRSLVWQRLGNENLNSIDGSGTNAVWAAGQNGSVIRLDTGKLASDFDIPDPEWLDASHPPRVTNLTLSHSEISSNCSTPVRCSGERRIEVRTTSVLLAGAGEFVYTVSAGKILGDGDTVVWDLTGLEQGKYTITAGLHQPFGSRPTYWGQRTQTQTRVVIVR